MKLVLLFAALAAILNPVPSLRCLRSSVAGKGRMFSPSGASCTAAQMHDGEWRLPARRQTSVPSSASRLRYRPSWKIITVASGLAAILIVIPASAAKPVPSGTIAIAPGSQLELGGIVTFDVTVSDLPGNANPRIQVMCYQAGVLVYGVAQNVEPAYVTTPPIDGTSFLLGGGASDWLVNGGAADCEATLYYWDFKPVQTFVPLASVSFGAGG